MNKVILIGNIGKNPEIKNLDGGTTLANFSIATSESYKNRQGEKVTDTEWHNVTAFGKLADIVGNHFTKGMKICIEGKIKTRSWEKDGEKKYATDIIMNSFEFIGGNDKPKPQPKDYETHEAVPIEDADDDLPF